MTFLTEKERLERYLVKDAEVGAQKAGRVDAIVTPVRELSRDPSSLAFGLGVGNVSNSALGIQFEGRYFQRFAPFLKSAASRILLELGLVGIVSVLALYWLVFRDARRVAESDEGLIGAIALAWTGVVATMGLGLVYVDGIAAESLSVLFWYFSGLIAAHRVRQARDSRLIARAALPVTSSPKASSAAP
jgi:hypothetical protein